ncbi:MAG: Ku protein, partial [Nocardioidaceae bacterium]
CALVKVALRSRETLALLRERDGALVLQTMLWPDEVRDSDFAVPDEDVSVRKPEVEMAESYIATLEAEFDPDRYHSDYREALEQLVEAKASGLPMPEAEEQTEGAEVVDLVAALRASVESAKERRSGAGSKSSAKKGSGSSGGKTTKKSASKGTAKTSTKKQPASKTTTKSSTKKKPAKKSA